MKRSSNLHRVAREIMAASNLHSHRNVFVAAVWCVLACGANALAVSSEIEHLEEIVVSATRSPLNIMDIPQSVSVLSQMELENSPFERVEDIVRSVPGVYNFRHNSMHTHGIMSPIIMRGAGINRVLILIDGVPQNDNFNNGMAWLTWGHIPKEAIERIEIIRGPTSALHGSEGLGGAINVVTKPPHPERETSLRGEAGTADTYHASFLHSQSFGRFGLLLTGAYVETRGFYMTGPRQDYEIRRNAETSKLFAKAAYAINEQSSLTLSMLIYDEEKGNGRRYFGGKRLLENFWLNYDNTSDSHSLNAKLFLNNIDHTVYQDNAADGYTSLFRIERVPLAETWGADIQNTFRLNDWSDLTVGAAYKHVRWDYRERYTAGARRAGASGKQEFVSPFAAVDCRFLDDTLIATLGGRYDWIATYDGCNFDTGGATPYDNRFHTERNESFAPKAGIAWHADENTTFRASGGKGFRAASLFERFKVHVRQGGRYYREANPDLDPETIWSYDYGVERFISDSVWARITVYQSFAKDYIGDRLTNSYVLGGKTYNEYILDNISEARMHGIETEMRWMPTDAVTLFGNYTFNVSKVHKDRENPELEGNYLPNDPKNNLHFGMTLDDPKIATATLAFNFQSDMYFDNENTLKAGSRWTVDIGLRKRIFNRATVYLNIENIFDEAYVITRSASEDTVAPGRIIMAGVNYLF